MKSKKQYSPEEADDSVQKYYGHISNYPLLKKKEEEQLFSVMQKWSKNMARCGQRTRLNGKAAREKIINSNLRLVVKMSKDHLGLGLPLLDLISEGNIGLMKAVEKYKLGRGAKFSTYASFWIRQCIFRALDNKGRLIRVPTASNAKYPKIIRYINEQEELTGERPTTKQIAKKFKTAEHRIISIMEARKTMTSMDAKVSDDEEDGQTWGDRIADSHGLSPDMITELANNKDILNKLLKKLNRRERSIIIRRFGINDKDFETLEHIGESFDVTRERIRQLETIALRKLRTLVRDEFSDNTEEQKPIFLFKF